MAKFSKGHYEIIAKAVKDSVSDHLPLDNPRCNHGKDAIACLLGYLCEDFKKDNPAFDADRFKKACGF